MSRGVAFFVVALISLAAVHPAVAADPQPSPGCRKAINARLPHWQFSPPPEDLAVYAKANNLATNLVRADFDGNGLADTAVLLIVPGTGARGERQYVAVCLTQSSGTRLRLIRDPYCRDGISVAAKGSRVMDYQTGKPVTYWNNGVTTYCFEKASGTYVYRNGRFILVVDGD